MSQGPDGLKDLWSRLGQTLRSGADTILKETKDLTKQGKLRVEMMSLENERNRKFEDIGRSVFTLYKGGATLPTELTDLFVAVDAVEKSISDKRAEIEAMRAIEEKAEAEKAGDKPAETQADVKPECPQCGAKVEPGDIFCSKCGTRVV